MASWTATDLTGADGGSVSVCYQAADGMYHRWNFVVAPSTSVRAPALGTALGLQAPSGGTVFQVEEIHFQTLTGHPGYDAYRLDGTATTTRSTNDNVSATPCQAG